VVILDLFFLEGLEVYIHVGTRIHVKRSCRSHSILIWRWN
jgi:hypothetical protein